MDSAPRSMYSEHRRTRVSKEKVYVAVAEPDGDGFKITKYEDGEVTPVEEYTVDSAGSCECPGFRFRKSCRHVKFLNGVLEAEGSLTAIPQVTDDVERAILASLKDTCEEVEFFNEIDKATKETLKIVAVAKAHELLDEPISFRFTMGGLPVEVSIT